MFNWLMISPLFSDDHSRVKLENSENDYINASLVMVEEAQRAYILSQVWCSTNSVHVTCLHQCMLNRSVDCLKKNALDVTLLFVNFWYWQDSFFLHKFLSLASTGAFEEYLWSFLADDLGAVFQSCYNAQQSYWKGICEYTQAPAAHWILKPLWLRVMIKSSERHVPWCHILLVILAVGALAPQRVQFVRPMLMLIKC